ncbi:DNA/RNA non-specific endonuclease [Schumannella sp. 10F1B-5-1]|uniref:DNA/RNA non-specific endonuclease n=1 Tax=Schumannella sp. 10F1B-5-1 TaxID=2590780 RepID=UPI0011322782|nr:DNA/RNA non-specific endonuclease [Schumannella sp. 10F1B-5-1]TPW72840.1 DNA/RNA non-specific endonuclease [Schumannella sp. 10F1B-5-1]
MSGYDAEFLGTTVPLPVPAEGRELVDLDSTHFSIGFDPHRKLAAFTAVNIDGARLIDLGRGDDWHLDARLPESQQTGPAVYARNDLDRGHLVRRRDPVWGDAETAAQANLDTFAYTNAAPQASTFNQKPELWLGLEDYVLEAAEGSDARLAVLTGPVFASDDPLYRGTRIPQRFWKVAAWAVDGELRATGYVLDQTALVEKYCGDRRDEPTVAPGDPELGAFRTFQVPIDDVAHLTALGLGPLPAADRMPRATLAPDDRWIELDSPAALRF